MDHLTEMAYSSGSEDGSVLESVQSPRSVRPSSISMVAESPSSDFEEETGTLYDAAKAKKKMKVKSVASSSQVEESALDRDELMEKQIAEMCRRISAPEGQNNSSKLKKQALANFFDMLCCLASDDCTLNEEK